MKRPISLKTLLAWFGVLLLVLLLGGVFWGWRHARSLSNFKQQLADAGERFSLAGQNPEIPESVRLAGAELYLPMMELAALSTRVTPRRLVAPGVTIATSLSPTALSRQGRDWTNTLLQLTRVERHLDSLTVLLSAHPRAGYQLDYKQGWDLAIGHAHPVRNAASMLAASVVVRLHQGESAKAHRDLLALLRLPGLLFEDRLAVCELIRMSCHSLGFAGVWELLQHSRWSDTQLQALQAEVDRIDFLAAAARALRMQRAIDLMHVDSFRGSQSETVQALKFGYGGGATPPRPITVPTSPLEMADFIKEVTVRPAVGAGIAFQAWMWRTLWSYEDEWRILKNYELALGSLRERTKGWSALAPELSSLRREATRRFHGQFLARQQFGYSFDRVLHRAVASEVERRLCLAALAVERFKLVEGHLPGDLKDLVPRFLSSVPEDLFGEGPVRFMVSDSSAGQYLLYSVGFNGTDEKASTEALGENEMPFRGGWAGTSGDPSMHNTRDMVWPVRATSQQIKTYVQQQSRPRTNEMALRYGLGGKGGTNASAGGRR